MALDNQFNVVYVGQMQDNVTEDEFVEKFCSKFGVGEAKARKIAQSKKDVVLKKGQTEAKAKQYALAFEKCGLIVRLEELNPAPEADSGLSLEPMDGETTTNIDTTANNDTTNEQPESPVQSSDTVCPKCGSDQVVNDECQACGIYVSKYLQKLENEKQSEESESMDVTQQIETPLANSGQNTPPPPPTNNDPYATPNADLENESSELSPEKVSAGSGFQWLGRGFWHFKQNPFAWLGAYLVYVVLAFISVLIPFLGGLIINLINPVFMAGFNLGADEQHHGGDFRVGHIFAGFSNNVGQLILVGLIMLISIFAISVLFGILLGGSMMSSGMMMDDPETMMALMEPGLLIMSLVYMSLLLVIIMFYWFAPTLIALENMSAFSAMMMSFKACLKNWLAFFIYGLLVMVLFIVASIPVLLGLLVAIPMFQASIYTSYRDIFHHLED